MPIEEQIIEMTPEAIADLREQGVEWALIYHYDSMCYTPIEKACIDWDLLVEARLFGEEKEIHIFKLGDQFKKVVWQDTPQQDVMTTSVILNTPQYKTLYIKKYIDYDEDRQAYISYVRPYRLD